MAASTSAGHRKRSLGLWVFLLTLAGLLTVGVPGSAADTNHYRVAADERPLCSRPIGSDLAELAARAHEPAAVEIPSYAHWYLNQGYRVDAISKAFPEPGSGGYVGYFIDFLEQHVVVVIDPEILSFSDAAALVEAQAPTYPKDLLPIAGPIQEEDFEAEPDDADYSYIGEPDEPLDVLIRASCVSLPESMETLSRLLKRDWHPSVVTTSHSILLKPSLGGRIEVTLPASATAARESLRQVAGAESDRTVVLREGEWQTQGRLNDGSPHYGGAAIGNQAEQNCTAGFALADPDGVHKWMVTAGHCTLPDINSSIYWYSGNSIYWGFHELSNNHWPDDDILVIGSGVEQYSRIIHTGPSSPTTRLVTSWADPTASYTNLCNSGKVTGAICGIVASPIGPGGITLCVNNGLPPCHTYTSAEAFAGQHYQGKQIGTWGDSGAPIYYRTGSSTARIIGMHVGGQSGATTIFLKPSYIQSVTGMFPATTCCNSDSY